MLPSKKWIIQDQSNGFSVNVNPDPEEEDELTVQQSQDEPRQWVIKQCTGDRDSYMYARNPLHFSRGTSPISIRIYSPKQTGLFWGLPNADKGTTVRYTSFLTDSTGKS